MKKLKNQIKPKLTLPRQNRKFVVLEVDLQDPNDSRVFGTINAENPTEAKYLLSGYLGICVEDLETSDDVRMVIQEFTDAVGSEASRVQNISIPIIVG
jgi:hypothetical protein